VRQLPHPKIDEITLPGVLAALSDPARLRIVRALAGAGCERPWGEFDVGVGPSTLSHHMKVLREAGVILHRKEGTRCFVALRPELEAAFPGLLGCILGFAEGEAGPSARAACRDDPGPSRSSPRTT
jgi:DNA-binding transcriptional ArsR family regulator